LKVTIKMEWLKQDVKIVFTNFVFYNGFTHSVNRVQFAWEILDN
jgi:hypothetical protein